MQCLTMAQIRRWQWWRLSQRVDGMDGIWQQRGAAPLISCIWGDFSFNVPTSACGDCTRVQHDEEAGPATVSLLDTALERELTGQVRRAPFSGRRRRRGAAACVWASQSAAAFRWMWTDLNPGYVWHGARGAARRSAVLCCSSPLYVDSGQGVGSGRGDVGFGRVKGHVIDGLFALLTVSRDLLHARFTVQVPEPQGAVVTWGGEEETCWSTEPPLHSAWFQLLQLKLRTHRSTDFTTGTPKFSIGRSRSNTEKLLNQLKMFLFFKQTLRNYMFIC